MYSNLEFKKLHLEEEINSLSKEKDGIETKARRFIDMYLKILLGVGVAHIASFSVCIWCVDWLGWDIIEPITYTLE